MIIRSYVSTDDKRVYASCTDYENYNQRPLSAAGALSRVSVCLAHFHYNRVSIAARAFRTER